MPLLALSFHGLRLSALQSRWKDQRQRRQGSDEPEIAPGGSLWMREPYTGGLFVVFDWDQNKVIWQIDIDGAMGFCWRDDLLYLSMMRLDEIVALDGFGREVQRFSHPCLNNIHTISPTQSGFLITSSGTDSIVELDQRGTLLYEWCALDHGYPFLSNGQKRVFDRSLDQRQLFYPTSAHTTHVNSARFFDQHEEMIVATLFSQGEIIAIDKFSGHTRTLVDGLKYPHDLRPYQDGWLVSDTGYHQTLLLDTQWQIRQRIALGFDWVQSSFPLSDGSIVIADTNHHRLVRVYPDDMQSYEVREYPLDWRIFQIEEVLPEYKNFFQQLIASSL